MIEIEFPGLAAIELETVEDLDDRALDLLARDLELVDARNLDGRHPLDVDARNLDGRHPLDVDVEELARRHNAQAARTDRAGAMLARWAAQVREAL